MVRLDGGLIQPNLLPIDAKQLFDSVAAEFRGTSRLRQIGFSVELADGFVRTDPALLSRVIRNLLANAFRYTDEGGQVVLASRVEQNRLTITVTDDGVGIAPEDQQRIFDEYVQLDNPDRERRKGLGIGLSIVRRLARLLKIDVSLSSKPGKGTNFTLTFQEPEVEASPRSQALNPETGVVALRYVVIVDDEKDSRDGMSELLKSWGCDVLVEASGDEARRALGEANKVPDLMIVDQNLANGETGIEVIDALRDEVNQDVPALLMTGNVNHIDGIEVVPHLTLITKPVSPVELKRLLYRSAVKPSA